MEVEVKLDDSLSNTNTGGGYRESQGQIYIDPNMSRRYQRHVLLHEGTGLWGDNFLSQTQIEDFVDFMDNIFDLWEGELERVRGDNSKPEG